MDPIDLPYDFDTRGPIVAVLKGTLGLLALMLAAGAWMLLVRHDVRGAAGTLLFDVALAGVARVLLHYRPGAEGRITRDGVEARGRRVWGIRLPGPVGTFPIARFRAVQAERGLTAPAASHGMRAIERVTLLGAAGTPDVPVMVAPREHGASPGQALAAALGLPCEVVGVGAR